MGFNRLDLAIKNFECWSFLSKLGGVCDCGSVRGDKSKLEVAQPKKAHVGWPKLDRGKYSQPV